MNGFARLFLDNLILFAIYLAKFTIGMFLTKDMGGGLTTAGRTTAGFAAGTYNPVHLFHFLRGATFTSQFGLSEKIKINTKPYFVPIYPKNIFFSDCKRNETLGFHPTHFISCAPLKEELLFQYFSRNPIHYYLHKFS